MDSQSKQISSKKRDYNAYMKGNQIDEGEKIYEEINQQYKQLHLERQQQRLLQQAQNAQASNFQKENNEKEVKINDSQLKSSQNIVNSSVNPIPQVNNNYQKEQNKVSQMQNIHTKFEFKQQKSQFFINKLKQYPKEEQTPYMLGFSDMFCKNPFFEYFNEQPERQDVQSIFMTTYGYETELLMPILKSNKHFVLANDKPMHDKSIKDVIKENDGFKNWTLIHPPKDVSSSWGGAFHPKLWLIKFSSFLRVVIGSGNLHVSDWSVWSNCLWYQDFPLNANKKEKTQQKPSSPKWDFEGDFKITLTELVKKMMPSGINYQDLLKINLDDYDYSEVKIILISSIVGRHTDIYKYGRGKMYKIIQAFTQNEKNITNQPNNNLTQNQKIITYQCTSLGNIDNTFLNEFYTCATANKPITELKKDKANKKQDPNLIEQKFRLIFPTAEYIYEDTIYGPEYASPVILNQKYYEKESFPKSIFHQFCSPDNYFYHTGAIPHLKTMVVTDNDLQIKDDSIVYIGSHNFTAAAWGRFEKDYSQIYNSNTELGIIYPPMEDSACIKQEIINSFSFKLDAPKYTQNMKPFVRNFED
ncbi:tyrosyl-DNA phosphodiesterase family protein (macronuclear) [Tetrahymena thermophila SB210]|uniref:Tyrosyl-DNA phosphodiesterase family protein n=1 Tax=Tetrahymena thermophila (strain SB210) TaxID=312017 RepID=I7MLY5_TETTS|nr:tyrosyl-DNA phosphodiesterase family protein [Tetrahymena thermophila SB210]EAS03297.1 tyrosyl-DNA phosphodiesterase family protein [Tetrahymena thermophila SB210]|eukprot:XP_001023542.1 tyrosyl-DNA phosphodiesterase family protein [Tetrahymena thermophila SB210]